MNSKDRSSPRRLLDADVRPEHPGLARCGGRKFAGYADFNQKDAEGSLPGLPLATAATFPPGSTFKVVTTTAVYNLAPQLSNFTFPHATSTPLPHSNKLLNNDGGTRCGGDIASMLPESV